MFSHLIQAHVRWVTLHDVFGKRSTIGSCIFVVAGTAAKNDSGSGLFLSLTSAGFSVCSSGFCDREFSSRVLVAGNTYTYAYMTLEYGISASTVAIRWSGYLKTCLPSIGLKSWMKDKLPHLVFGRTNESDSGTATVINFAAPICVGYRIKASTNFTLVITVWNLCLILLFIIAGSCLSDSDIELFENFILEYDHENDGYYYQSHSLTPTLSKTMIIIINGIENGLSEINILNAVFSVICNAIGYNCNVNEMIIDM